MFDFLKEHNQIIITGPHRAGTTIATEMIAHDLDYGCLREERVTLFYTLNSRINDNHLNNKKTVYQAPLLASQCHTLPDFVAVVFMIRNVDDIIASEKRINWGEPGVGNEPREMDKYFQYIDDPDPNWKNMSIADVKYHVWNTIQKKSIKFAYELEYNKLSEHELWVPKEQRKVFTARQTKL